MCWTFFKINLSEAGRGSGTADRAEVAERVEEQGCRGGAAGGGTAPRVV